VTTETQVTQTIKRAVLIGDVHGEADALAAILAYAAVHYPYDALLCTGDVPAKQGVGSTSRCIQLLMDADVQTIRGNHDRWYSESDSMREVIAYDTDNLTLEQRAWLATLPPVRTFETASGPLYLCHGVGTKDMEGIYPGGDDAPIIQALEWREILPHYRYMVAGHTHYRMMRQIEGITILNPGVLRFDEKPGFVVADFDAGTLKTFDLTPFTNEVTEGKTWPLPPTPSPIRIGEGETAQGT
jgi:predicted phosphodiesterase